MGFSTGGEERGAAASGVATDEEGESVAGELIGVDGVDDRVDIFDLAVPGVEREEVWAGEGFEVVGHA